MGDRIAWLARRRAQLCHTCPLFHACMPLCGVCVVKPRDLPLSPFLLFVLICSLSVALYAVAYPLRAPSPISTKCTVCLLYHPLLSPGFELKVKGSLSRTNKCDVLSTPLSRTAGVYFCMQVDHAKTVVQNTLMLSGTGNTQYRVALTWSSIERIAARLNTGSAACETKRLPRLATDYPRHSTDFPTNP